MMKSDSTSAKIIVFFFIYAHKSQDVHNMCVNASKFLQFLWTINQKITQHSKKYWSIVFDAMHN